MFPARPHLGSLAALSLVAALACNGPYLYVDDLTLSEVTDSSLVYLVSYSNDDDGNIFCRPSIAERVVLQAWSSEDMTLDYVADRPRGGWPQSSLDPGESRTVDYYVRGQPLDHAVDKYLIIEIVSLPLEERACMRRRVYRVIEIPWPTP